MRDTPRRDRPVGGTSATRTQERRIPRQARSRRRVEDILEAASRLVLAHGVDALTTRTIAEAAEVPVASLYQYFADKEDVLLALLERDMAEMDAQVAADLGASEPATVGEVVGTVMRAFTQVFARRPAFVEIWLRGRGNAAIRERGRVHNREVAETLRAYSIEAGLTTREMPAVVALLAVEVGDRIFQLAYEEDVAGDPEVVAEGIRLVTAYLDGYAA